MKIYLAGTYSRDYVVKEAMKEYLQDRMTPDQKLPETSIYILESFFYMEKHSWMNELIPHFKGFLLDSGAFSTFKDPEEAKKMNWDNYVKAYIKFIRDQKIKLFFELDIDAVVGLPKVEYYRKLLEDGTGLQCIPVWHASRKWEYFERLCEEYKNVALGTTRANNQGKLIRGNPMILKKFINTAHKNSCKIHGLGFTSIPMMKELNFDSVDSTAWLYGNRGGYLYFFDGSTIVKHEPPPGMRLNGRQGAVHNFNEWIKFQRYAEKHL